MRTLLVVGLIVGWGAVAIHGGEGFRARRAAIRCLLADSVWDESLDPLCDQLERWLAAGRWLGLLARSRSSPSALQEIASEYAVPVLPLADAVRSGVLAEFGLPHQQLERAGRLIFGPDGAR